MLYAVSYISSPPIKHETLSRVGSVIGFAISTEFLLIVSNTKLLVFPTNNNMNLQMLIPIINTNFSTF